MIICTIYSAINCTEPPPRPEAGTWEGQIRGALTYIYQHKVTYTCGPYGEFQAEDGTFYKETVAECVWNKTWVPPVLDHCVGNYVKTFRFLFWCSFTSTG